MRVIHYFNKFTISKILILVLVLGLVVFNVTPGIRVFASFAGGGMGAIGYSSGPGYKFEGLYTVAQNYRKLESNSANVYVISDYSNAPTIWIKRAEVNSGGPFYVKHYYKVYDDNESEIEELSSATGRTSNYSYNDEYETSTLDINLRGKYTDHIFELYNVDSTGSGPGENLLETIPIRLTYADYNKDKIPSVTISDIRQAGQHLSATNPYGGDYWYVQYDNRLDLEIDYHVENLLPGMYFRTYVNYGEVILDSEASDVTVKYYATPYSYSPQTPYHNFYAFSSSYLQNYEGHSRVQFNSSTQNEIPYFDIEMIDRETGENINTSTYSNSDIINIDTLNYTEKPLAVKIKGYNYTENEEYTLNLTLSSRIGEPAHQTITKTGAELNNSVIIPYEQEIGPIKIQDLLAKPMNAQGYDVLCNIGYSTKGLGFWYYPSNFWVTADMFNSNGESFIQNSIIGSGAGDAGLIYGAVSSINIRESLLTDKIYLGLNTVESEFENYDYYLFRSDNTNNDFTTKEFLSKGIINTNTPTLISVGNLPKSGTTYSAVLTHDDTVDFVYHFQVNLGGGEASGVLKPLIFNATSDTSPVYIGGIGSFSTVFDSPTDVQILMEDADPEKTYRLEVEGMNSEYAFSNEINGALLDGSTTLFTLPAQSASDTITNKAYGVAIFSENQLVSESHFSVSYTDSEDNLNQNHAYNDLLKAAYNQITNHQIPEGSFSTTLTAPESIEGEFDVYLSVEDYDQIIGSCVGICGIVGELEYDHTKLELVSAEALAGFEIEHGDKIVLYKSTGVEEGTNIMKLTFRNFGMSANETATITFKNIEGSDGVDNIPTDPTSVSVKYEVPFRFIRSHVFSAEGYEINSRAGAKESESANSTAYQLSTELLDMNDKVTIYYDGYGFESNTAYSYTLTNVGTNQTVTTGTVTGQELNNGSLYISSISPSVSSNSDYVLTVYDGNTLIYTYTDNFWLNSDPDLYIELGYGYSKAGIVDGSHVAPYGNDIKTVIKTNGLEDSTTYQIEYKITDYKSCIDSQDENGYVLNCTEDDSAHHAVETISLTGAELKAGAEIILPAPQPTTTSRNIVFSIKNPDQSSPIQTLRFNDVNLSFVNSDDIIDSMDDYRADDMVINKISPNTSTNGLSENLFLKDGYHLVFAAEDSSPLAENALIGTGSKIIVKDSHNQSVLEYTAKIKGDTSGDGKVTILDLVQTKRHLAGVSQLEGIHAEAGDVTSSGSIGITDVVKICRHVAGLEEIRQ